MNHSLLAAAAALSLIAAPASAITKYVTTFDYTPAGLFGTSIDPSDGNRIVVEWSTTVASGAVEADDLTDLSFTLFGDNGVGGFVEIFRDDAIIGGVGQTLGGLGRTVCGTAPCNIEFEFDLDDFFGDAAAGAIGFNTTRLLATGTFDDGTFYSFVLAGNFITADQFVDGVDIPEDSTTQNNFEVTTTVQAIPLPAPALMLLSALGAMAVAGWRKTG